MGHMKFFCFTFSKFTRLFSPSYQKCRAGNQHFVINPMKINWQSTLNLIFLSFMIFNGVLQNAYSQQQLCTKNKIVVFSKTQGFRHDSIPEGIDAVKRISRNLGFEVIATEESNFFLSETFKKEITLAIFLNTTGDVLNETEQLAFENFISSGGSFLGIHSAADTEYHWPFYRNLVGAEFKSHPSIQDATIDVIDHSHPCTCHLPSTWVRSDEWYDFKSQPKSHVKVLLNLDEKSYTGGTMGDSHPIAWFHEELGGRALYTGGGHTKESFNETLFVDHLSGAISWLTHRSEYPIEKISSIVLDELTPTFPDIPAEKSMKISEIDAPKGSIASFHVALNGLTPGKEVEFKITFEKDASNISVYNLRAVPVEENTGIKSRTEEWENIKNPHVIREAPFKIHEVLIPVNIKIENKNILGKFIPTYSRHVLRVEKNIKSNYLSGTQNISITTLQKNAIKQLPLTTLNTLQLTVHDTITPPSGQKSFKYTNWFNPTHLAQKHNVKSWSTDHWELLKEYAKLMYKGRQNTFWFRWTDFLEKINGRWTLNKDRAIKYVEIFTNAGLWWIEGAPIANRPNGDWSSTDLNLIFDSISANGPIGSLILREIGNQIKKLFKEQNWEKRWIQHISDEPTDRNAKSYSTLSKQLKKVIGDIPIIEATMSQNIIGAVDIWCPKVNDFQNNYSFFQKRLEEGEEVWTYACLAPGGPWINRLLDQERMRQVAIGWGAFKNNTSGFLHWGLSQWKADPYIQSVVDHPSMPNTKNKLPAGDTHVLFPGNKKPFSGLRFEAHRIGLEDYELLKKLAQANKNLAHLLSSEIFERYDSFQKNPKLYRSTRKKLLIELSKLSKEKNNAKK